MNSTPNPKASTTAKAIARHRFADDPDTTPTPHTDTAERFTFDKGRVGFGRAAAPQLLPGVVKVPVGPIVFDLYRVDGAVIHPDGRVCNGLTYPDRAAVFVDVSMAPGVCLATTWHELGHALLSVYNVGCRAKLGEETICDVVGMFLAGISPEKYSEIVRFITRDDDTESLAG